MTMVSQQFPYLFQLKETLCEVFTQVPLDCFAIHNTIDDLQKFLILNGMCFSKSDHVALIQWHMELLHTEDLELFCIDKICKILCNLLKKEYLVSRQDTPELVIQWRPLYNMLYKWEQSSGAVRGTISISSLSIVNQPFLNACSADETK